MNLNTLHSNASKSTLQLDDDTAETANGICQCDNFLDKVSKPQAMKEISDELCFLKTENFSVKDIPKEMKAL